MILILRAQIGCLHHRAKPIKAIAYQPHTEDYGKLVSAYVKNKKVDY